MIKAISTCSDNPQSWSILLEDRNKQLNQAKALIDLISQRCNRQANNLREDKAQRTVCFLLRALVTSPQRAKSWFQLRVTSQIYKCNVPCMCGIIYERKITIRQSLFRSERCCLMQRKRGETLSWKVYLPCNLGLISDKPLLTACIRFSAAISGCLWKISHIKLKCDF